MARVLCTIYRPKPHLFTIRKERFYKTVCIHVRIFVSYAFSLKLHLYAPLLIEAKSEVFNLEPLQKDHGSQSHGPFVTFQYSIPFMARMPSSYPCFIFFISVTVSASSMILSVAYRPVSTTVTFSGFPLSQVSVASSVMNPI